MVTLLREHLTHVDAELTAPKKGRRRHGKAAEYVFASERGEWLRTGRLNTELRRIALAERLRPLTMYELRHAAVSLYGEAGVHLRVAADIAGHGGTEIPANVYTRAGDAMHREGIDRVEAMLAALETGSPSGSPDQRDNRILTLKRSGFDAPISSSRRTSGGLRGRCSNKLS